MATAVAHPNIALVKYWGKQDKPGNLPATPNISITLDDITTRTTVTAADKDTFRLNGSAVEDTKLQRFLQALRTQHDIPPLDIDSTNDFPTGAGLASSASGFAALMCAINAEAGLGMDAEIMSEWARLGSASAARSMFAGFVCLVPPQWRAHAMAPPGHWPLTTIVAVTSEAAKSIGSTEGMERSRQTSPYYGAWVRSAGDDFAAAADAIERRDFAALSSIAEHSCLKMHSLMLTSQPALVYWNAATVDCMSAVRRLRDDGADVFFTIDAGPQVKAICQPESADQVEVELAATPGVLRTIRCGMGEGARIVDD